jgi:hypothetical protein
MDLKLNSWKPKNKNYGFNYKIGETFTTRYSKLLKEKINKIAKGITRNGNQQN